VKILIYSDVHGNLPAFEKMLEEQNDYDGFVCLGDLVNYGPWSNECVDLALSLPNSTIILGNHEEAFINGFYPGTNIIVQEFFKMTYPNFYREKLIKSFLLESKLDKFICKHTINNSYVYPDTQIILDNNYIIGHSHHQFEYRNNNFVLYNSGSVGQNRKFINVVSYINWYPLEQKIELKNIQYDVDKVINKMQAENYPKVCLDYYLQKTRL